MALITQFLHDANSSGERIPISMMEHLRIEIWDHIYRSGPQSREQLAESLRLDPATVAAVVEHEWFEILDSKVQIATGEPPKPAQGLVG